MLLSWNCWDGALPAYEFRLITYRAEENANGDLPSRWLANWIIINLSELKWDPLLDAFKIARQKIVTIWPHTAKENLLPFSLCAEPSA